MRLLILQNQVTIGIFSAPSSHVQTLDSLDVHDINQLAKVTSIIIEHSGVCFTKIDEFGRFKRQLIQFASNSSKDQVRTVVDFRNRHSDKPIVTKRLHILEKNNPCSHRTEEAPIAHWPHNQNTIEQSTSFPSIEKNAILTYHFSTLQAQIRFLCEVMDGEENASAFDWPSSCRKERFYTWVTKSVSCREIKHSPLQKLSRSLLNKKWDKEMDDGNSIQESDPYITVPLPQAVDLNGVPDWSFLSERGDSCAQNQASISDIISLGHNMDQYLFTGTPTIVEWRPEGTYKIVELLTDSTEYSPGVEVEVTVHFDNSIVLLRGDFVHHYQAKEESPDIPKVLHVFATNSIFVPVGDDDGCRQFYSLGTIAARARKFREQYLLQTNCTSQVGLDSCPPESGAHSQPLSVEVHRQYVGAEGVFTAFKDHRVRVLYTDRTILELSACQRVAKLLTKEGESCEVAVSNPYPFDRYVKVALEFSRLAFLSNKEQLQLEEGFQLQSHAVCSEAKKIKSFKLSASLHRSAPYSESSFNNPKGINFQNETAIEKNVSLLQQTSTSFIETVLQQNRNHLVCINKMLSKNNKTIKNAL